MGLKTGFLTVDFYLEGCGSLKEKRKRVSGLKERFGKIPNIAVCESDFHDSHKNSRWSFVAVSNDSRVVEKLLASIEEKIEEIVDAQVTGVLREHF